MLEFVIFEFFRSPLSIYPFKSNNILHKYLEPEEGNIIKSATSFVESIRLAVDIKSFTPFVVAYAFCYTSLLIAYFVLAVDNR